MTGPLSTDGARVSKIMYREDADQQTRFRGVNTGGWLVLEKWMTPSLFEGLSATDETTWCAELGRRGGCPR